MRPIGAKHQPYHAFLLGGQCQIVAIVAKDRKCSTSYIQRELRVGYNKAAKLVSYANHGSKREVLVPRR